MKKRLLSLALATLVLVLPVLTPSVATMYENEPNNYYWQADVTYDDEDNYGTISSAMDSDCYEITFDETGFANFWLGNIPDGCDYNLHVYDSEGYVVAASEKPGTQNELIRSYLVHAGETYYVSVYSYFNYSTTDYYWMRVKNYPCTHSSYDIEYVANHPHQEYQVCLACGDINYLNSYVELQHGNGIGNTCPDCGDHANFTREEVTVLDYNSSGNIVYTTVDRVVCPCGEFAYNLLWHCFGTDNTIKVWFQDTDYQSYVQTAISTWNSAHAGLISTTNSSANSNLIISTYYDSESYQAAVTTSTGRIKFNSFYMNGFATSKKTNCAIHEMGHALGLAHSDSSSSVMYRNVTNIITLSEEDLLSLAASYERLG